MSNLNSTGLFDAARKEKRLCAVAMNDVQFLAFHESTISAIGTEGLSGCSVVMITSQYGAILAHIPPRPSIADPQDIHAGDRNVRELMSRVMSLYTWRRTYFPTADTFVLCAVYRGDVALPIQKTIIESSLSRMELPLSFSIFYEVPADRARPGQGTALIDSKNRARQKPAIFVEDRCLNGFFDDAHQYYKIHVDEKLEEVP
ncbi:hypothetical protein BDY21DRAFT_417951 [Lineolata rhizophorae]|uniref:Uncharacterized protein n=1 Tax=Lineolata rhizophorae TaxID=578093 RepID=A0A6A6PEZ3_9PEZI|nr:hypothetical protein BDY21DRAFT_417951 [Lineolata rhizophorae]